MNLPLDLELMLLVEAGFTPLEAIRTATLNGARCLGLAGELGSVEVGKRADLILVRGDPATDLRALGRIEHMLLGGRAYAREDLVKAIADSRDTQPARRPAPYRARSYALAAPRLSSSVRRAGLHRHYRVGPL